MELEQTLIWSLTWSPSGHPERFITLTKVKLKMLQVQGTVVNKDKRMKKIKT